MSIRGLIDKNYVAAVALAAVAVVAILYVILIRLIGYNISNNVPITAFTTIAIFVIGILQIERAVKQQRANFVKDYIASFFTNEELARTFQKLIKEFTRGKWDIVETQVKNIQGNVETDKELMWNSLSSLNQGRPVGTRFYHPRYFQGSEEELKLDALLGFFDIIGYYQQRGFIDIEDVAFTIGFYVRAIGSNYAVNRYLYEITDRWRQDNAFRNAYGVVDPFAYLTLMIAEIERYDQANINKLQKIAEKVQTRQRRLG